MAVESSGGPHEDPFGLVGRRLLDSAGPSGPRGEGPPSHMSDDPTPPTLADLIRIAKGDGTYYDLEGRMPTDQDTQRPTPGWKRLEQIANNPLKSFPDPGTIRNLAIGLGFTEMTIVRACCASLGIPITDSRSRLEVLLPPGAGDLPEDAVAAVLALVRTMVAANRPPKGRRKQP